MMPREFISSILLFIILCSCQHDLPNADLIITNANIWTGNESQPKAEAMAIAADTIMAIGTYEEINFYQGSSTKIVDAKKAFITPGFIDTHVHLLMGGNALLSVELRDANTQEEFTQRIANHAKTLEPGAWILEGNWDHTLWGGELPKRKWIDQYTKENPVVLYRLDGHMVLANSLALQIAAIDKNTPNVAGGEIVKDNNGFPTGILKGNAMRQVLNKVPVMSEAHKKKALKAAMKYLNAQGVTSVHDVDSIGTYSAAKALKEQNELSLRIYTMNPLNHWSKRFSSDREDNKWLKTGGLKGFVDGSLGSHTAAFKEPYSDKPTDSGFFINSEENLYKWISKADEANLQVSVHAIGDKAIHVILNIYERIIIEHGKKDRRLRVEHAQHIATEDLKRFAELGVIASMQPYHAIDDGRWAEAYIGSERIKTTYAFKSLLNHDTTIVFGSDWPVAPATPLEGIYAATTRRTTDGKNPDGWVPEQKIHVEEALIAYTRDAAFAAFNDHRKGTLEPGKLADFVIISADVINTQPTKIKDLHILQTYVGGKKVYDTTNH